jgi:peptide/nickel transport system permease protein
MSRYLLRRLLNAVLILVAVNLLTFMLFFVVNSPEDMARMQLGSKRVTPEAIERWKQEKGYDKPRWFNPGADGVAKVTDTIFFEKSVRLFLFEFGNDVDGRSIRPCRSSWSGSVSTSPSPWAWPSSGQACSTCGAWCCASGSCRSRACSTSSAASTW